MKAARGLLALAITFTIGTLGLGAQDKLTTVAILDVNQVYLSFHEQSAGVREYNRVRQEVQDTIRTLSQELVKVNAARMEAQKAANAAEVLRLDQELATKAKFLADYRQVKTQELANMQRALDQGDEFKRLLDAAVEYTAISQGFTIVLQVGQEGADVYWYSPVVDITTKVLEYLRRTVR